MNKWIWIAALVTLIIGCSGKTDAPSIAPAVSYGGSVASNTGGRHSTGGSKSGTSVGGSAAAGASAGGTSGQGTSTGGATGGSGGQASTGPVVKITSPVTVSDPNNGPVLDGTQPNVTVLCTVTAGTASINTTSIKIALTDSSGKATNATSVNTTSNANEYSAIFPLAQVPQGTAKFQCTASDNSSPTLTNSDTVNTFVDHGPTIVINSPQANAAVSGNSSLPVSFNVTPTPLLSGGDSGSDVDPQSVTLQVDGVTVPVQPDASDPTLYTVNVRSRRSDYVFAAAA